MINFDFRIAQHIFFTSWKLKLTHYFLLQYGYLLQAYLTLDINSGVWL